MFVTLPCRDHAASFDRRSEIRGRSEPARGFNILSVAWCPRLRLPQPRHLNNGESKWLQLRQPRKQQKARLREPRKILNPSSTKDPSCGSISLICYPAIQV